MRDGVSISSEDRFGLLFGNIFSFVRDSISKDIHNSIKTANLKTNEALYKKFVQWDLFEQTEYRLKDLDKSFEFKNFEQKRHYNQVIGRLLDLYLLQGDLFSYILSGGVKSFGLLQV